MTLRVASGRRGCMMLRSALQYLVRWGPPAVRYAFAGCRTPVSVGAFTVLG